MNAPEGKVGRLLDHLAWVAARVQGLAPGAVGWRDPVALESAGGGREARKRCSGTSGRTGWKAGPARIRDDRRSRTLCL